MSETAINFQEHVYPPFHGEPTHPDPKRLIVPIDSVYRDPENARLHPDRNIKHVRASLRRPERGQQSAIKVDRNGKILKGNGTHESAELEGWTHIWIEVSNLEGPEATAYAIADNAAGLSSQWDFEQLASNVKELKEFDGTPLEFSNDELCFEEHEVGPMLAAEWKPPAIVHEPAGTQEVPAPNHASGQQPDGDQNAPELQQTAPQASASSSTGRDPHEDLDEGDRSRPELAINTTPNMRVIIDLAIERVRLISGDLSISEGRCIELICADYLAGAPEAQYTREELINGISELANTENLDEET